ncbi:MAG: ABC transporter permease/ATP-binding protein [Candidatus Tokpelaia sp. JSC189]|nr:MAG: ABC transporter permease/ATP-binding protein [Candidatus Tokpelaia sp. JSC189]
MTDFCKPQQVKKSITAPKRHSLRSLATLYPYIKRHKYLVLSAFFSLIIAASVMLILPISTRYIMDRGFSTVNGTMINSYFAMLLFLVGVLALASAVRYYSVITLGEQIITQLRHDVFAHLITLSPGFYDRSHSGEIISRLSSDTTHIKSVIGATISITLRNMIIAIGAIAMMIITSLKLSTMVLTAIPVVVIPLIGLGRKVKIRTRLAHDKLANASALASEQLAAIRTVQAFNAQPAAIAQFSDLVMRAFQAAKESILSRTFLTGFAIFLIFGSVVAILWIGSQDVLNGQMTGGALGQFVIYAILASSAFGQLSEVGGEFAQAAGAAERLTELLHEKPDIQIPEKARKLPIPFQGRISFNNVSFSYFLRPDVFSINQLSFSVKPGEKLAIVGPSGAGKSTIFSLLLRFYDPQKGKICLDNVNLQQAAPYDIRAHIAYVAQDTAIFDGTLRQNITFGKESATEHNIQNAAHAANAYDFIMSLKNGFDTRVGERGITLSGGQKQRIAIARALLRNAPILLLDEATSALDAESEMLVQEALEKLMVNCTTLVIAHRLATVLKADRILVMDNGKIIEEGRHDTLMKQSGLYARLAKLQFAA